MELKEAQSKFIQTWGNLGSQWGISRTMAQIHALLMISSESITTDDVMDELMISRGNANMNLRALMDWGIAQKEYKMGERKDYFFTEKDVFKLSRKIAMERRRREIKPVLDFLGDLKNEEVGNSAEAKEFKKMTGDLHSLVSKADRIGELFEKADENWFTKTLVKAFT